MVDTIPTVFDKSAHSDKAILGFRVWKVHSKDFNLKDRNPDHQMKLLPAISNHDIGLDTESKYNFWWEKNTTAKCGKSHTAPDTNCSCGLYAYKTLAQAVYQASHLQCAPVLRRIALNESNKNTFYVVGLIAAAGKVENHKSGWRAEKAQILSIASFNPSSNKDVKTIAENLGVSFAENINELQETFNYLLDTESDVFCSPGITAEDIDKYLGSVQNYTLNFFKMTLDAMFSWLPIAILLAVIAAIFISSNLANLIVTISAGFLLYLPYRFLKRSRKLLKKLKLRYI